MHDCSNCTGGGCGGCEKARSLEITEPELDVLRYMAQIPFVAVARRADDMTPICQLSGEEMPLVLQCLEKKMLIDIDYGMPLKGFDYRVFPGCSVHGSAALTLRGQQVLDLLDRLGADREND